MMREDVVRERVGRLVWLEVVDRVEEILLGANRLTLKLK